MTETDPLPPIPLRPCATALPQLWIDELDTLRRFDPDLPSRAELIRHAVGLFLTIHRLPLEGFTAIYDLMDQQGEAVADLSKAG